MRRSVVLAFLRRDLRIAASYRVAFVGRPVTLLASVATLAMMARFVGDSGAQGGYLGFWLTGIAAGEVYRAVATGLAAKIRNAQLEGTLEAILATPAAPAKILLAMTVGPTLLAVAEAAVILGFGLALFDVRLGPVNAGALALVAPLALVAFAALGLLGGAITMLLRRTDPVTALIAVGGVLVGSVLFPASALPPPVHALAYALPLAPALDALRPALFAGATLAEVAVPLRALALFTAVASPCALLLFAHALRRARIDGSLGHY